MDNGTGSLDHVVRPAKGNPEGILVLLHGRGADEHDLYPLFDMLDPDRHLIGVCPRGPLTLPPGGAHWYVVQRVGYPDPDTFFPTLSRTRSWLESFVAEQGVTFERVVIGGFSQGAVMSYALGLEKGTPRPAGLMPLSGFIPVVDGFEADLAKARNLSVAIGHGTFDPVIEVGFGRDAKRILEEAGADLIYRESPMQHTIDPSYIEELKGWLVKTIGVTR